MSCDAECSFIRRRSPRTPPLLRLPPPPHQCRACPDKGVTCNSGVLKILPDYWYDTKAALIATSEGKLGIGPTTQLYKCSARAACLPNASAIPATMYCDENHTGVLCERCFHRSVDCGRVAGSDAKCVAPRYFERSEKDMYFAKIARRCYRCPAGEMGYWNFGITFVVAVGAVCFTSMLVLLQIRDVESGITGGGQTSQPNATGSIARMILNWLQATALLSTIKLTPPEAVRDASVFAEFANGFSVSAFPIMCTVSGLRKCFLSPNSNPCLTLHLLFRYPLLFSFE